MSFLRIRSPYHEPRDVPQGPSHAHVSTRMGIRGGSGNPILVGAFVVGVSNRVGHEDGRRGRPPRGPATRPTCGKTLPRIGGLCARRPGHGWDCQSAERLAKTAERRRSPDPSLGKPTKLESQERRRAYFREWQRERRAMGLRA